MLLVACTEEPVAGTCQLRRPQPRILSPAPRRRSSSTPARPTSWRQRAWRRSRWASGCCAQSIPATRSQRALPTACCTGTPLSAGLPFKLKLWGVVGLAPGSTAASSSRFCASCALWAREGLVQLLSEVACCWSRSPCQRAQQRRTLTSLRAQDARGLCGQPGTRAGARPPSPCQSTSSGGWPSGSGVQDARVQGSPWCTWAVPGAPARVLRSMPGLHMVSLLLCRPRMAPASAVVPAAPCAVKCCMSRRLDQDAVQGADPALAHAGSWAGTRPRSACWPQQSCSGPRCSGLASAAYDALYALWNAVVGKALSGCA